MLEILQLKKHYGNRVILEIPRLTIPQGIHWVRGKNGSGKTTLLKTIGGTIPFEGIITLHSINLTDNPLEYRKQVSFVEAEPLFPDSLTGWEILRFVQKIRRESDYRVKVLTEHLGIQNFIDFPIHTYSSGMIKKLSLVQAFIGNTKLILLDEPLITLEDEAIPLLSSLIQDRLKEGVSFLFTSHQTFPDGLLTLTSQILIEHHTATYIHYESCLDNLD